MLLCKQCHSRSGCTNAKGCEMKFTFGPVAYGLCEICHNRDFQGANADGRQACVDCTSCHYSVPPDTTAERTPSTDSPRA